MSLTYVSSGLRRQSQERAGGRCEYCLLSEAILDGDHLAKGKRTEIDFSSARPVVNVTQ